MQKVSLIATATFGLESVVAREVKDLGYEVDSVQDGRVYFQAGVDAICRCNLWLRSADRLLLNIGSFDAFDFGELFDNTYDLPWQDWLPVDARFPVNGRSIRSQLSSVPACQRIVKKAIVQKIMDSYATNYVSETGAEYIIEVALLKDKATLTLDTTGVGLHKRGYRTLSGEAPLKETLAAGLIQLSFWRAERPLIDPFCGTGTIPIEAAMIGINRAPGLDRTFAAEMWLNFPANLWNKAREEARDLILKDIELQVIGGDIDHNGIRGARHHAKQAGVADQIHFQQQDFSELASRKNHGCLVTNPPYGERIGQLDSIRNLYLTMPSVLRRLSTWSHFIITSHQDFERIIGKKANRRRKLYNGRIECTYYQYHGPRPERDSAETIIKKETDSVKNTDSEKNTAFDKGSWFGKETVINENAVTSKDKASFQKPGSVFGALPPVALEQAEQFKDRLLKRARHLRKWPTKRGISCYRLYERDIPVIPLVVDCYGEYLHITEFDRPHDRSPAEHADWLELMATTAGKALSVPRRKIFLKHRPRQRGRSQHERLSSNKVMAEATEGELRFLINLSDYVDTGLFLDHRLTRDLVRQEASGKRFLNLFAYTGSFSVYAADGGAESTTTVDMSNTYLDWAWDNMRINGFTSDQHIYLRDDVLNFLRNHETIECYDLAVVDPPTFSNSKRMLDIWDIQRDHVELISRVLSLMPTDGVIYFSTNFRRFKMNEAEINGATVREISKQTIPEDFRSKRIHRCWRIVKL